MQHLYLPLHLFRRQLHVLDLRQLLEQLGAVEAHIVLGHSRRIADKLDLSIRIDAYAAFFRCRRAIAGHFLLLVIQFLALLNLGRIIFQVNAAIVRFTYMHIELRRRAEGFAASAIEEVATRIPGAMDTLHMVRQALATSETLVARLALVGEALVMLSQHMHRQRLLVPCDEAALFTAIRLAVQLRMGIGER